MKLKISDHQDIENGADIFKAALNYLFYMRLSRFCVEKL